MQLTKPISVLVVEDNIADATYVQEMLSSHAYTVTHKECLFDAQDCNPRTFDIVLLDLSLPDGSGLQTFLSILGWSDFLPIVILTCLDDEEISMRAVKLGAQDYIVKNEINEHVLTRTIRYALERKQSEENSKRLAVLEQHEEFMATLTHDLKNPLIGANRILELMANQIMGVVSPEQSRILLQLRDSNRVLLSTIQNLIEVYRFEKDVNGVTLENVDLLSIATACISEIAPIAEMRSIRVETEFVPIKKDVLADGHGIRRVVQNLLDNALKFTPDGGQISLTLHAENGSVILEIGDTGPGISADEQTRLFKRFSQGKIGKKYTPGTGLGLYLCKQIVDAHHGEITCNSAVDVGTRFIVTLPAA